MSKTCPRCGALVADDRQFCDACGKTASFGNPASIPPIQWSSGQPPVGTLDAKKSVRRYAITKAVAIIAVLFVFVLRTHLVFSRRLESEQRLGDRLRLSRAQVEAMPNGVAKASLERDYDRILSDNRRLVQRTIRDEIVLDAAVVFGSLMLLLLTYRRSSSRL